MLRPYGRNIAALILPLVPGILLIGCGSHKSSAVTQPLPNIAGSWEFIAVSNNGSVTGIEVALKEGQVLIDGLEQPNGLISASSTQIAFVSLNPTTMDATGFGGPCPAAPVPINGLGPGAVTALGEPFNFTFAENGNVFNVTAMLSGDGKSFVNGTYTAQTGNPCTDPGGAITGTVVTALPGLFAGNMCPLSATSGACQMSDSVNATVSENSSATVTLTLAFTAGPDAGTNFTMTGPATGNTFLVEGTFQGQPLSYYGYFEQLSPENVGSLYFVNAADPCIGNPAVACTQIGLLAVPPPN